MTAPLPRFLTVSGAAVGRDPFHDRSWSGSSRLFLLELQRQHGLHRAIGVEADPAHRAASLLRNFSSTRQIWRDRLYLDTDYRNALTKSLQRSLKPGDAGSPILQFAGYYDSTEVAAAGQQTFAYYDGTLALRLRSAHPFRGVSKKLIEEATRYETRLAQSLTGIFTMSEHVRQSFIHDYGAEPDRVVTIGGGFNFRSVPNERDSRTVNPNRILFIGVDFERKGGWLLLDAFAEVRAAHPSAELHIVGPKNLAIPRARATGVVNHGFLPNGGLEMQDLFQTSAVFIMPSLHEAFGIAPLEAMLYGMPAVVTGEWALADMVQHGVTGHHVAIHDVDSIRNALLHVLREPAEAAAQGRRARARVLSEYSWSAVVRRLLSAMQAPPLMSEQYGSQ